MKFSRTAGALALVLAAGAAHAEVTGSAGVASSYLWRGLDLGDGTPAVSGALKLSKSGFYAGIWGSSGDTAKGSEYHLSAGYNGNYGEFFYGIGAISYNYPTKANSEFGDFSDGVVTLGYGPVSFGAYIPVGKLDSSGDYMYFTLGASFGSFSTLLGVHSGDLTNGGIVGCELDEESTKDKCTPIHLDLTYAYNENLSFTLSQFIDDKPAEDKLKFIVSFGFPIGD